MLTRDRQPQRAVFGPDDFEDLDQDSKFEAFIQVSAISAEVVSPVRSEEEFLLEFGHAESEVSATSGQIVRTLVDGAIAIATRAQFDQAVSDGHLPPRASEDKKGFISWRGSSGRSIRVLRPVLIRQAEEDWREKNGAVGRWVIRVRADGSPAGPLEFIPFNREACEQAVWDKVAEAVAKARRGNWSAWYARTRSGAQMAGGRCISQRLDRSD